MCEKKRKAIWFYVIPFIEILILTYVTYRWGHHMIDSDDSGELILGRLLNGEGRLLSNNWYYSAEIRIFNTHLVIAPLFSLFSDFQKVRTAAVFLVNSIYAVSYLWFCRQLSAKNKAMYYLVFLIWPISYVYTDMVLFGMYYIPYLLIEFICAGACIKWAMIGKKNWPYLLLSAGLAFLSGLNGMRMLIEFYIPFLMSVFALVLSGSQTGNRERNVCGGGAKQNSRWLLCGLLNLLFSTAGFLVNKYYLQAAYSFYDYNHIQFTEFKMDGILNTINGILWVLGYRVAADAVSFRGIFNLFVLMLASIIFFALFKILLHIKKLSPCSQLLAFLFVFGLCINFFIFSFTDAGYADRYFLPVLIWIFPLAGTMWEEIGKQQLMLQAWKRIAIKIAGCITGACLLLNGTLIYADWAANNGNEEREKIVQFLVENGYHFGYASFLNANVITELSEEAVVVCSIDDWPSFHKQKWLSKKSYNHHWPAEPVFILFTRSEWEENRTLDYLEGAQVVYENDHYCVLSFDNKTQLELRTKRPG